MLLKRISVAVFALTFVSLAACSDDDESAAAGGPSAGNVGPARNVHVDEVKAQLRPLAEARCQWLFRCCQDDEIVGTVGRVTAADCTDRLLDSAARGQLVDNGYYYNPALTTLGGEGRAVLEQLARLGNGFDFTRIKVDTAALDACAKSISGRECAPKPEKTACAPHSPKYLLGEDPCDPRKILVGTQKQGDECAPPGSYNGSASYDCGPGFRCTALAGNDGVCIKDAAVGDTCFSDRECGTVLICDWQTGRCAKPGEYGEACSFTDPEWPRSGTEKTRCRSDLKCDLAALKCADGLCSAGAYCEDDATCPAGLKCVHNACGAKGGRKGEPCNRSTDCAQGICANNLCSDALAEGAFCYNHESCASHFCTYDNQAGNQVCKPQVALDGECTQGDEQCVSGRCRGQKCVAAPAAGTDCTSNFDCTPLACANLKCAARPFDVGTSCENAQDCKSNYCIGKKCVAPAIEGASCGGLNPPCGTGLFCNTWSGPPVCQAKKGTGAKCTNNTECSAGYCTAVLGELRCQGSFGAICTGR